MSEDSKKLLSPKAGYNQHTMPILPNYMLLRDSKTIDTPGSG